MPAVSTASRAGDGETTPPGQRQPVQLDALDNHHADGEHLPASLVIASSSYQVVDHADRADHRAADQDGAAVVRDLQAVAEERQARGDREPGDQAAEDRDAAEVRDRNLVDVTGPGTLATAPYRIAIFRATPVEQKGRGHRHEQDQQVLAH